MPDLQTKARIEAVDRASAPFTRVGRSLRRKLAPALSKVSRAATRAAKRVGKVGLAVGVLGGAAAIAGIVSLVSSTAAMGDSLDKVSQRADISVQTLAELRHVAKLSGLSADEADKGFEKFSFRLGKLQAGTGALNAFLNKVSPNLAKMMKGASSNEDALLKMLGAIGEIPDQSRRAALADAAFGKAGQKLAIALKGGTEAMEEQRATFRKYFGTVSVEGTKAAAAYVDAQENVTTAIDGTKFSIGSKLLPVLTPLLIKLADWVAVNRDLIANEISGIIADIAMWIDEVEWGDVWQGAKDFWAALETAVNFLWDIKEVIGVIVGALVLGKMLTMVSTLVLGVKAVFGWFTKTNAAAKALNATQAAGGAARGVGGVGGAAAVGGQGKLGALGTAAVAVVGVGMVMEEVTSALGDVTPGDINKRIAEAKRLDALFEAMDIDIGAKLIENVDIGGDEEVWKAAAERYQLLQTKGVEAARVGLGAESEVERERQMPAIMKGLEAIFGPERGPKPRELLQQQAVEAEVKGEIRVRFEDAPEGMRVEKVRQTGTAGVDITADVGRRPAPEGG